MRLYEAEIIGQTSALLLERCSPGATLGVSSNELEQDVVITALLRRLWAAPGASGLFRDLAYMCDQWVRGYLEAAPRRPQAIDPGLERAALQMFAELPRTATEQVLLATDLHAGNVLSSRREPWLAIDPKPYLGDPTYDALQHMLNCPERLLVDPASLVARMAELLDLDPQRLSSWLFSRALLESPNQPWLYGVARRMAP